MNTGPRFKRRATLAAMVASVLLALYALAGFVLLPAFVERQLPGYLNARLPQQLSIGEAQFNPFLLRFDARRVTLAADDGAARVAVERLLADLTWVSLLRLTWTFEAVELDGLAAHVALARGAAGADADTPAADGADPAGDSLPPLHVERFALRDGRVELVDQRGAEPAQLALGPVSLEAVDLTTRAERSGHFQVRAGLPGGGSLGADGQLSPGATSSEGRVTLSGLQLATLWPFVAERIALAPPRGALGLSAAYRWDRSGQGPTLVVEALDAELAGLVLAPPGDGAPPLLALDSVAARGGRFELDARRLQLPELTLGDGTLRLAIDAAGRLDWTALARDSGQPAPADGAPWQVDIERIGIDALAVAYADRRPEPAQLATIDAVDATFALALAVGGDQATVTVSEASAELADIALTRPDTKGTTRIGAVALTGGRYDSAARRLAAERIVARGGRFELVRDAAGQVRIPGVAGGATDAAAGVEPAAGETLNYAIGRFALEDFAFTFADRGFEPAFSYPLSVSGELANIDRAASAPIDFEARLGLPQRGRATARGTLAQDASHAEARVELAGFALRPLQPMLTRYAPLELVSGRLGGDVRVRYAAADRPRLRAEGRAELTDFRVDERASGDRFLSATALTTHGTLTLAPDVLHLAEIGVREPGAKLVISEAREFNVVAVFERPADKDGTPAPPAGGDGEPPFAARIDRIHFTDGVVDFADLSLVLPFSTRVEAVKGSAVGIDMRADASARLEAEGNIQPFGSARVAGSLRPRAPTEFTDIRVNFDNVPMPPLSPYTATFAGRTVASGKLWLDLQYRIVDGRMEGHNDIELEDFRLGERVEAPTALDLPLDLAVALLKNDRGRIDIAVPVEGDVSDPQFDYGSVIRAALAHTLRRVVTAPFRLLAGLVGRDRAEDLEQVAFAPGSERLAPAEQEDLQAVAEALGQRPQLRLTVGGPYDPQRDGHALRAGQVRQALARALGRELAPGEDTGPFDFADARTQRELVALAEGLPPPTAPPVGSTAQESEPPPGEAEAERYRAMFEQLVERWPLDEEALRLLAVRRARAITGFLVEQGGIAPERVVAGEIRSVQVEDDAVPVELEVGVVEGGA